MNDNDWILIESWMGKRLGLRGNLLSCFALIHGYSKKGNGIFIGGIKYICDMIYCTEPTALSCLDKLIELELIGKKKVTIKGHERCAFYARATFEDGELKVIGQTKESLVGPTKSSLVGQTKESLVGYNNKYKENKNKEKRLSNDNQKKDEFSQDFLEFWELYDNKKNKVGTYKKWKNLSATDKKEAIAAIPAYFADCKAHNNREKKHPLTYLNQRTWEDDFTSQDDKEEKEETQADEIPADDIEVWNNNQKWMQSKTPRIAGRVTFKMFSKMRALSTWNNKLYAEVLIEIDQSGYDGDIVAEFERRLDKHSKV